MSVSPLPVRSTPVRRAGHQLVSAAAARVRKPPSSRGMARRHLFITFTKWMLPLGALLLLASIALWPEIGHMRDTVRIAIERDADQRPLPWHRRAWPALHGDGGDGTAGWSGSDQSDDAAR